MKLQNTGKWIGTTALGMALISSSAYAAGVEAGTEVINEFTLNYKSSGVDRPQVDNLADPTRFIIDNRVDLTTADNSSGDGGTPGQTDYDFEFTASNLGNKDTNFSFTATDTGGDFAFASITPISYWIDTDGDGTQDGDEPTVLVLTTPEPLIPQDVTAYVTVRAAIPASAGDGETGNMVFTATATDGSGATLSTAASNTLLAEETVLDDGSGVTDSDDDGIHTSTASVTIATAVLTGSKTVQMLPPEACDASSAPAVYDNPIPDTAGNFATPGSCALYTITANNTGSATATDIDIVDILPNNLILHRIDTTGFTSNGSYPLGLESDISTGISSGDFGLICDGTATTCNVAYTGATLDPDATGEITLRVRVNTTAPTPPELER